jgi:hypothetical protein
MFTYNDVVVTANQLELYSLLEGGKDCWTPIDDFFYEYIDSHYNIATMNYPDSYLKRILLNDFVIDELIVRFGKEIYELISFMVSNNISYEEVINEKL